jgi:GPH family glycoside/pentoside/hexuronide:cation symporter
MTQTLIGVLGAVPMAVASLIVWPISNKIGKKNIALIGMIIGVIGGVISIIAPTNLVVVSIGIALKCLGSAPACYLILAMISDVIDHLEIKNGFRSDGFTMSIYSSIMTGATGIGTALFNAILGATKYQAPTVLDDGTIVRATQNAATQFAIQFSYLWVETIGFAICIGLLIFFTVEKNLKKNKANPE